MSDKTAKHTVFQGEGTKEAARKTNRATREFVKSGKAKESAKDGGNQDSVEGERAEQAGLEWAKGKDSEVRCDYRKPTKD